MEEQGKRQWVQPGEEQFVILTHTAQALFGVESVFCMYQAKRDVDEEGAEELEELLSAVEPGEEPCFLLPRHLRVSRGPALCRTAAPLPFCGPLNGPASMLPCWVTGWAQPEASLARLSNA